MSSVKTQLHSDGNKGFLFSLSFVWRQSGLRFSVRQLRLAHFLFLEDKRNEKLAALFLAILMIFSLVACGETNVDSQPDEQETNQPQSTTAPGREYDETDPAAVLGEITNDFADVTTSLTLKLEETFTAVGTTYEDYQKNKGLVDEWINLVLSEPCYENTC